MSEKLNILNNEHVKRSILYKEFARYLKREEMKGDVERLDKILTYLSSETKYPSPSVIYSIRMANIINGVI